MPDSGSFQRVSFGNSHKTQRFSWIRSKEISDLIGNLKNASIHTSGSFADLLCACDALVSASSTTIEEALVNKIPVFPYDGARNLNMVDAAPVEEFDPIRPVVFCGNSAQLSQDLTKFKDICVANRKKR